MIAAISASSRSLLAAALFVLTSFGSANADSYYASGNAWRRLSVPAQATYIIGVIDGWQERALLLRGILEAAGVSPPLAAEAMSKVAGCLGEKRMTSGQLLAIVEQYMTAHPKQWHEPMPDLIHRALSDVCTPRRP